MMTLNNRSASGSGLYEKVVQHFTCACFKQVGEKWLNKSLTCSITVFSHHCGPIRVMAAMILACRTPKAQSCRGSKRQTAKRKRGVLLTFHIWYKHPTFESTYEGNQSQIIWIIVPSTFQSMNTKNLKGYGQSQVATTNIIYFFRLSGTSEYWIFVRSLQQRGISKKNPQPLL